MICSQLAITYINCTQSLDFVALFIIFINTQNTLDGFLCHNSNFQALVVIRNVNKELRQLPIVIQKYFYVCAIAYNLVNIGYKTIIVTMRVVIRLRYLILCKLFGNAENTQTKRFGACVLLFCCRRYDNLGVYTLFSQ